MATLSITVTASQMARISDALKKRYPVAPGEVPLTGQELGEKFMLDMLKHEVYEKEYQEARRQVTIAEL